MWCLRLTCVQKGKNEIVYGPKTWETDPIWCEPSNWKLDSNWYLKKLNWFRAEIRNWIGPKLDRLETVLAWFDLKLESTRIELEMPRNLIDPIRPPTRNDSNWIRIDLKSYWLDVNPNPKLPEPNQALTDSYLNWSDLNPNDLNPNRPESEFDLT